MKKIKKYDIAYLRTVKHGVEDENAYCRHCDESWHGKSITKKARSHATKTLHTVDIYRENHIEITSYVPVLKRTYLPDKKV